MIRRLIKGKINSITVAAALVAISSLLSRLLGVIRDRVLAGNYGASETLDIYYAAFRVPDLIFNLVVLGALSAGFVPIFTKLLSSGGERRENSSAWFLTNNVLNILSLVIIILSIFGMIFAVPLVKIIAPGFQLAAQEKTAVLTRIMFLSPLFLGISGVLGGVLQSAKRFFVYSLAPIAYNAGIIVGAIYFSRWWGIAGLAWGVVLGAFLHALIQVPAVINLGFRYQAIINWKDQATLAIGKMMIPRTLSLAVSQFGLLITTIIASFLPNGSLAVFNFANNLESFPVGIFGISFAVAAFPALAEHAFDQEKLGRYFSTTMRQILFFIIPSTVLMITLRAQIIRVVLGSGAFSWQDTILTMETLGFFSISLFAQATLPLLTRVFYARHDSKTPFYYGLMSVILDVVLSLWLGRKMGVTGLALAFSISSTFNFVILWLKLYLAVSSLRVWEIFISAFKFSVAAIFAGMIVQLAKLVVWPYVDMTRFSGVFIQLVAAFLAGLVAYALMCKLLGSEELDGFLSALRGRWPFKKVKIGDQSEAQRL